MVKTLRRHFRGRATQRMQAERLTRKDETDINAPAERDARLRRARSCDRAKFHPKKAGRVGRYACAIVIGFLKGDGSEISSTLLRHELIHQEQIDRHGSCAST
jgi:hypothetical protein